MSPSTRWLLKPPSAISPPAPGPLLSRSRYRAKTRWLMTPCWWRDSTGGNTPPAASLGRPMPCRQEIGQAVRGWGDQKDRKGGCKNAVEAALLNYQALPANYNICVIIILDWPPRHRLQAVLVQHMHGGIAGGRNALHTHQTYTKHRRQADARITKALHLPSHHPTAAVRCWSCCQCPS